MAGKSIPSGMIMPYGVAIGNALSRTDVPTDELLALRDHAHAIVSAQGDLVAALKTLDAEIGARSAGKADAPVVERFVAQIEGAALPHAVKAEIEQAIQHAVSAEIAKIDTGGDMVATTLSAIKDFGVGLGSRTPGLYLVNRKLSIR
jgi:Domain of unknown function (DUF1843)